MNDNQSITAIYPTHLAAAAVKALPQSGFDLNKLSIVGRDYRTEERVVGCYNTEERMKSWGARGVFWGWIWGCLFGSAFFFIPGPGPLAGWLVGALGAGLIGLGIPKDRILQYETALKAGKFVLIIHGSAAEAAHAKPVPAETLQT